jgi:23S rRNA (guanine2445-N2)-methyltransferase / 23S rRNA (guanine2069-N7)-methyltransferase
VREVDWSSHLEPHGTIAVDVTAARPKARTLHFVAQKVKDAIVDQSRERCGRRPRSTCTAPMCA